MLLRFTEFIKHGDREIGLYIVQETDASESPCFKVYVKDNGKFNTILWKKQGNIWEIVAQDAPEWIMEIKEPVIQLIEQRIFEI